MSCWQNANDFKLCEEGDSNPHGYSPLAPQASASTSFAILAKVPAWAGRMLIRARHVGVKWNRFDACAEFWGRFRRWLKVVRWRADSGGRKRKMQSSGGNSIGMLPATKANYDWLR